jgi:peptidoglycan/LPS O-acetylase OafA/YrhL
VQPDNRAATATRRGDIQGLRGIAVGLVVAYHAFPDRVPGGFVGVDVFFVISGFLITLLLVREIDRDGRISLWRFYARRIRRLMPAALTVTLATVVVAGLLLGPLQLAAMFEDAAWATAYLANYRLSQADAGYFASTDPSLFTHFWSLAVEEQYYLVWPLLLTAIVLIGRGAWRRVAPVALGLVLVGSLVASVLLTATDSNDAYYSLGARAWELAIGGAVAFAVFLSKRPPPPLATALAAIVGLAAVVWTVINFTEATPFPSWTAAVPTVGAALIIWAGSHELGDVARVLGVGPLRFLGDISYPLYLWHWPVLLIGTSFVAPDQKLLLVALSVALAVFTYYGIERTTARFKPALSPVRVVAGGLIVAFVVAAALAAAAASVATTGGPAVPAAKPVSVTAVRVGDAIELTKPIDLDPPEWLPENVRPTLQGLPADLAEIFTNGCTGPDLRICEGGDPDGTTSIVLTGDSQAAQWWPAIDKAATEHGWKLYLIGKNGCPLADFDMTSFQTEADSPRCSEWQDDATQAIVDLDPDLIIYANLTPSYTSGTDISETTSAAWAAGVSTTLTSLGDSRVLYFGQFPMLDQSPDACLYGNIRAIAECDTPVATAVTDTTRALAESNAAANGAMYFDPATLLCDDTCPMVNNERIMYRDAKHLNGSYSRHLAPALGEVVSAALLP